MDKARITIDIVSDVVCPWCYLGQGRLRLALAELEGEVDALVTWKPFQLEPNVPPEGYDTLSYLANKIGGADAVRRSHAMLTDLGREIGLPFNLDKATRFPNTLDAHRLIRWAGEIDPKTQDGVAHALFKANFVDGLNVGDPAVLAAIATEAGMPAADVTARLADGTDVDAVQADILQAQRMGVSGVPCFILDGRYSISGAQPVEVFVNSLRQFAQMKRPAAE